MQTSKNTCGGVKIGQFIMVQNSSTYSFLPVFWQPRNSLSCTFHLSMYAISSLACLCHRLVGLVQNTKQVLDYNT